MQNIFGYFSITVTYILSFADPHWFGSLDPDPDPHRIEKLDPDPHGNQCGSTTLILSGHY
jgi:hypothetical protein